MRIKPEEGQCLIILEYTILTRIDCTQKIQYRPQKSNTRFRITKQTNKQAGIVNTAASAIQELKTKNRRTRIHKNVETIAAELRVPSGKYEVTHPLFSPTNNNFVSYQTLVTINRTLAAPQILHQIFKHRYLIHRWRKGKVQW